MERRKVILKVAVDISYEQEREFWARLEDAKKALQGCTLSDGVIARDAVTHDIPKLP